MEGKDIHMGDWERILTGSMPPSFFIEVSIRLLITYLLLFVAMRVMGKRMSSKLSRNETAAIVVLAAAVGVPILSPSNGLLPAVIIAIVVVIVEMAISRFAYSNQAFEKFSQGDISILLTDAAMNIGVMKDVRISRERLFGELRAKGITHLGKVARVYLEAGGNFVVIKATKAKPGLSIIPEWDTDFYNEQKRSDIKVCSRCGCSKDEEKIEACHHCGAANWVAAIE